MYFALPLLKYLLIELKFSLFILFLKSFIMLSSKIKRLLLCCELLYSLFTFIAFLFSKFPFGDSAEDLFSSRKIKRFYFIKARERFFIYLPWVELSLLDILLSWVFRFFKFNFDSDLVWSDSIFSITVKSLLEAWLILNCLIKM